MFFITLTSEQTWKMCRDFVYDSIVDVEDDVNIGNSVEHGFVQSEAYGSAVESLLETYSWLGNRENAKDMNDRAQTVALGKLSIRYSQITNHTPTELVTLGSCLDESHCYTLEVSFFSYQTNTTGQSMPYTEEAYMKLGRNLARTFLDYYKLTGFISAKPSSSLVPKISGSGGQGAQNGTSQGGAGARGSRGDNGRPAGSLEPSGSRVQGDAIYNRKEDRFGRKSSDQNNRAGSSYSDMPSQQQLFSGHPRENRRL
ncbi:hypothetical protein RRG08_003586 [Elysia crispata]|uniref:Uncharacterized protein n=1 Tax=Elysia crispata TaxID=231223 RepID=A0AAE0YI19_9GAST|nr:hypothetical protein RRG08_003586 [Elysia crispata]